MRCKHAHIEARDAAVLHARLGRDGGADSTAEHCKAGEEVEEGEGGGYNITLRGGSGESSCPAVSREDNELKESHGKPTPAGTGNALHMASALSACIDVLLCSTYMLRGSAALGGPYR